MSVRPAPVVLLASGVTFALFPLLRPWSDKDLTSAGMAAAFGSPWWVVAHLLGAAGFVLLAGALALRAASPSLRVAAWLAGAGTALVLPFFGAETFGLQGVAQAVETAVVPAAADAVRTAPAALTTFGLGLVALAGAGVAIAVAQWRTGYRRWAGLPLAVGLVCYLPQFFLPAEGRIAHGVLMLAGALVWAAADRVPGNKPVVGDRARDPEATA